MSSMIDNRSLCKTYGGTELTLWEIYIANTYIRVIYKDLLVITAVSAWFHGYSWHQILTHIYQLLRYVKVNYWQKIYISQYLKYIFIKSSIWYHRKNWVLGSSIIKKGHLVNYHLYKYHHWEQKFLQNWVLKEVIG